MTAAALRVGSLFAGYDGIGLAVERVLDAERAWFSEIEPAPSAILAHHWPDVPNHGDLTKIDWSTVEPVDIITGGFPCFAADTPVLTRRGLVPIQLVEVGDEVWTHRSRWRRVSASAKIRTTETVEFRPGFYCTPEHLLWLRATTQTWVNSIRRYKRLVHVPEWTEAKHSKGMFSAAPIAVTAAAHTKPDTLSWWQVGRFLADGYTNHQVNIYIGKGKLDDVSRFPGWSHIQQETALKLTMPKSSREKAWLDQHFGKMAHGKTLPAFVLALSLPDQQSVYEGYMSGDGHAIPKNSRRSVSVSPCLSVGIELLAASLGYTTSLSFSRTAATTVIEGRTVNQRDWWSVTSTVDDGRFTERDDAWLWRKLRSEPKPGPIVDVYDLTVEQDHSFVAAGIVVHNCQDLSLAGKRAGMAEGTRSGLWSHMAAAIETIRPRLVVAENVRGLLSGKAHRADDQCPGCMDGGPGGHTRALGVVLGDLARLGYDAQWVGLRASEVGAPHQRFRVVVVAHLADADLATPDAEGVGWPERRPEPAGSERRLGAPGDLAPTADTRGEGLESVRPIPDEAQLARHGGDRVPTPGPDGERLGGVGRLEHLECDLDRRDRQNTDGDQAEPEAPVDWGKYGPAIRRWEPTIGRHAPRPTEAGTRGGQRLSPIFVEWMMGLPLGHVTDPAIGLTRSQQLKALGNGVVPQQVEAALRHLLTAESWNDTLSLYEQLIKARS